jgi:diacylglycerol kinase family enzyme
MHDRPWVAIQRNPRSGSGSRKRHLIDLCRELRRRGLRPRLFSERQKLREALEIARRRNSLRCIIAAGGDGTVADVLNRFPGIPLAVFPLGTENLLARYLQVPRCGRFVAEMLAAGKTRRLDLGRIESSAPPEGADSAGTTGHVRRERRFLIMASVGVDADVIHRLEARRRGNITHLSYVPAMSAAFSRFDYPPLRVVVDGGTPIPGSLAVVANLPMYAFRLPIAASAVGDDGRLDVRVFERPKVFQLLRYCYHVIRRRHERLADVHALPARGVRIESSRPAPVQVDGDSAGWTPVEISVLPGELEVFVP